MIRIHSSRWTKDSGSMRVNNLKLLRKNEDWHLVDYQINDKYLTNSQRWKFSKMMKKPLFLAWFAKIHYFCHLKVPDNQQGHLRVFRKSAKRRKQEIDLRKTENAQHIGYESFMKNQHRQSTAPDIFRRGHLRNFMRFLQGFQTQTLEKSAKLFTKSNWLILKSL